MESNESNKRITNERLVTVTANVRYNLPSTKPSPDGLFNYSRSGAPGLMSPQILMPAEQNMTSKPIPNFAVSFQQMSF